MALCPLALFAVWWSVNHAANQVEVVAQPYLRAWRDLNETDLTSYQALVEVFASGGVLRAPMQVRDLILKLADLA